MAMNALQQLEVEELNEIVEEQPKFEIANLDSLNWAFRKISALSAQQAEIDALAQAEKKRIQEWQDSETASIKNSIDYFKGAIAQYHAAELENGGKKTIATPFGKSKATTSKEQPDAVDKDALLAHVEENGLDQYVKVKKEVAWGDIKKNLIIGEVNGNKVVIDETGQIVPGVNVKPESTSFKVEV